METYSRQEAADRAGVSLEEFNRQVEAGILKPDEANRFSAGEVRKAGLIKSLQAAGLPLDGLAEVIRQGGLNLDFMDDVIYERFAALSNVTFEALSEQTGVPVELLMVIREAIGSAQPAPQDRVREDELVISPFIDVGRTPSTRG